MACRALRQCFVADTLSRTGLRLHLRSRDLRRDTLATGTVKKIISDRGFGFITAEDDGKDYFFHRDSLQPSLSFDRLVGGERVNFEVEASPRGPRAVRVQAA